jgi:hypothetical protein
MRRWPLLSPPRLSPWARRCLISVADAGCQRTVSPFSRSRIRHCSGSRSSGASARAPPWRHAVSICSRSRSASRVDRAPQPLAVYQVTQGCAGNGTISNHRQEAEQPVRSPRRNPANPGHGGVPTRFPTDQTALPGTRRHTCGQLQVCGHGDVRHAEGGPGRPVARAVEHQVVPPVAGRCPTGRWLTHLRDGRRARPEDVSAESCALPPCPVLQHRDGVWAQIVPAGLLLHGPALGGESDFGVDGQVSLARVGDIVSRRGKYDPRYARPLTGGQAHRAWLAAGVQHRVFEKIRAHGSANRAPNGHLRGSSR